MSQVTVKADGSPLEGGEKIEFEQAQLNIEEEWAYRHACYWYGKRFGVWNGQQVEGFAAWFAQGWMDYLENDSPAIDAGMKVLYANYLRQDEKEFHE